MTTNDQQQKPVIWRFLRFGMRTLMLAITLACIGLAWYTYKAQDRNRLICEQLVHTVLIQTHYRELQSDERDVVLAELLTVAGPHPLCLVLRRLF